MADTGVLNGVAEETILAGAGPILTTGMTIATQSRLNAVRFTVAGSVPAIFTLTGWASFSMSLNGGLVAAALAFVVDVRPGMVLNIESDRAGTFKVVGCEVVGGVI